jgi:DNA-binding NarL/FixJ family response regulator
MAAFSGSVLLVDDDEQYLELVSTTLERAGYRISLARSGEEALALSRSERPAIVVLDVKLPGVSGYEVCRQLKDAFGDGFPVIFVSGVRTEAFDRAAGLLVGADDYLVKPFEVDEFMARIRKHVVPGPGATQVETPTSALTPREREVFGLLADGLDQGEIADRLVISSKTVSTHIQHILEKLGVHSRAQAVSVAYNEGLRPVNGSPVS